MASEVVQKSDVTPSDKGISLTSLDREFDSNKVSYEHVNIDLDRELGVAYILIEGPLLATPDNLEGIHMQGDKFWPLALSRQLDLSLIHI